MIRSRAFQTNSREVEVPTYRRRDGPHARFRRTLVRLKYEAAHCLPDVAAGFQTNSREVEVSKTMISTNFGTSFQTNSREVEVHLLVGDVLT